MVIFVGVSGATGSGKTTVVKSIVNASDNYELIKLDDYFKDRSLIPKFTKGDKTWDNFEVPEAMDMELLLEHLKLLKEGKAIETPIYKKKLYTSEGTRTVTPKEIIFVEGFLLFAHKAIRDILDLKIALDLPIEQILIRRVERFDAGNYVHDDEYYEHVCKRHYIEIGQPSLQYADHNIKADQPREVILNEFSKVMSEFISLKSKNI